MAKIEYMFRLADSYREAGAMLAQQMRQGRMEFLSVSTVCSAFALELYLKCEAAIEGRAAWGHDLSKLFEDLANDSKVRIEEIFHLRGGLLHLALLKGGGVRPTVDAALKASKDAFHKMRYIYDLGGSSWAAGEVTEAVRIHLLELHPEWDK
jgi:hypothetical protein